MTMTNVLASAGDDYFVYRPILDLLGKSEGTDKGRGYNETLAYGAYTGNVNLVGMTLAQIDALQGKMLANPKNKWKSSALGRYQIVRTTRRNIQKALSIPSTALFDKDMQDRMACFLLGQRGIDKWLAGRLSLDTLLNNMAREWASLPTAKGKGFYGGQNAGVSVSQVKAALAEVAKRHADGQPKVVVEKPVPVPVETPIVPASVGKAVKNHTRNWGWGGIASGGVGAAITSALGDWKIVALFAGIGIAGAVVAFIAGPLIVRRFKQIQEEVEG
jgi:muramidase (phage lysozyme)